MALTLQEEKASSDKGPPNPGAESVIYGRSDVGRTEDSDAAEAGQLLKVSTNQFLKDAQAEVRLGFVRKVYGILAVQLLLTMAIAAPLHLVAESWLRSHSGLLMAAVGMTFATVCAMACCQSLTREYPTNYIVLFVFTAGEAIIVGFVSACYTWQSVLLCAGLSAGVFFGLTAYACTTKADFTGFGPYLFGSLLALCVWGMAVGLFTALGMNVQWAVLLWDLAGILVFVLYIIYDTQMILGGAHSKHQFEVDDYVFAAMNLYLDIVQLFLHLLRFLGEKN